jgi:hypothetical protein
MMKVKTNLHAGNVIEQANADVNQALQGVSSALNTVTQGIDSQAQAANDQLRRLWIQLTGAR